MEDQTEMARKQDDQEQPQDEQAVEAVEAVETEAPADAPVESAVEPVEAPDLSAAPPLSNIGWYSGVPTAPFLSADEWRSEYDWQVEHNSAFQPHMMPPKPEK